MSACEYVDDESTLRAKVRLLAHLLRQTKRCVIYSGAGLSTGAGIGDYASQAAGSLSGAGPPSQAALAAELLNRKASKPAAFQSPFCAQPTLAHRVLVALHRAGYLHRWVNQNHDGLPQKAGLPQEAINEIHGAWHAPDNPVVPMAGSLRDDLFEDLLACERDADLAIAIGTSLCGMNADRVVVEAARRAAEGGAGQLGAVIVGLQRTVHDGAATLRIFARCDDVFALLAEEMALEVAPLPEPGTYFTPPVLVDRAEADYLFGGLAYDAAGDKALEVEGHTALDLREDAQLVIARGMHAGAVGVAEGFDREGNVRCRFTLRPRAGKLRAPVAMLLGRWWIQAAVDGKAPALPVVNVPDIAETSAAAQSLRKAMHAYAA